MADNINVTPGSGAVVGADDIGGGVLAQRVKPVFGPDGTGTDVSTSSGLPIQGTQTTASTTSWTSATTVNTANSISVVGMNTVTVAMHNTSTMTGGVLTFEVSPDNTNWFPITMARIDSFTTENTYTLSTVADRAWSTSVDGFTNFRVRLSTVISGTGTATVIVTGQTMAIEPMVNVGQSTASNLNMTVGAALPAGGNTIGNVNQAGTWTVQPGNTANTTPWLMSLSPPTSGGLSTYHLVSAATTNASVVKASAGQLYGWYIYNSNAAARKVAFHNASTTPTAGASIFFTIIVPPTSAANVFSDVGIAFSTGIAITTVTDLTDAGTTAVALNDLNINLFYK